MNTGFCLKQQNFALEGQSRIAEDRIASNGRILLRMVAFCFEQPRFASDGRVLLQTTSLCFG